MRTTIFGYTPASSQQERSYESRFLDLPSSQGALDAANVIGAHPHYAGTPADYNLAVYMRDQMRSFGIDADLEMVTARVDTPRTLVLEMLPLGYEQQQQASVRKSKEPPPIGLDLRETPLDQDPETADPAVGLPFNSGSGDGDVTAPIVYAGHGLDADYDFLQRHNVNVKGDVVLVRYGAQFRGLLAQRAQARGAAGVIFYNDPADDGLSKGAVYPNGPWRPMTSIQRGSVGANVHIPTLPVSGDNAARLLGIMRGPNFAAPWAGALPAQYPVATGTAKVHLAVKLNRTTTTLWNTIGRIRGTQGDQSVLIGAHRDAWVFGVGDNGAGVITMLEVARGLGYLVKNGWQPKRTIVIAGWDGEEIGLVGSLAYVNRHNDDLRRGAIAYLNADENVAGQRFGVDAVGAIASTIVDVSHEITDPINNRVSIYDRWSQETTRVPPVNNPGGGSDHESFLYHLGTPVASLNFSGPLGPYHSSYDTVHFATLFSDPGFALHRTAAQIYGAVTLRLANADVVPYRFSGYVPLLRATLAHYRERARRERVTADFSPLAAAVASFAGRATRIDGLTTRAATGDRTDRQLLAVQIIDNLAYAANGYESVTFPALAVAFATHDPIAIKNAIVQSATRLDQASAYLR